MKNNNKKKDNKMVWNGGDIIGTTGSAPPRLIAQNLERYRAHVAHLGLSSEREAELIITVGRIVGNFVDSAFGDDPIQHVHGILEVDDEDSAVMVGSDKIQSQTQEVRLSSAFAMPAAGRRKKERS